jgi:hypothetical protein
MTNIIFPGDEEPKNEQEQAQNGQEGQEEVIQFTATEEDEERFFLMYHLNFQPSEVEALKPEYRKWLIMRFVAQKNLEQEAMQRQRLMQQLGPNLKV